MVQTLINGNWVFIFLSPKERILEVDPYTFQVDGKLVRGAYDSLSGKIFLCRGNWCRKTLIHEILHKLSAFFQPTDRIFAKQNLFIREGITEFLIFTILSNKFPLCYNEWKANMRYECKIGNDIGEWIKLWIAFCRFIPIEHVLKFYFYDGKQKPWTVRWKNFMESIHKQGYHKFHDILRTDNKKKISHRVQFIDECIKCFPNFKKYLENSDY